MNRIFDLVAVLGVAVVVLLPKASLQAKPALVTDAIEASRVATLEDAFVRTPASEPAAIDLAEQYLRLEHPDWALVTLAEFKGRESSAKLSLLRATAHAERLEAVLAVAAIADGRAACQHGCPPAVAARLALISGPMQALVDANIDPRTDPQRAKEAVGKALHATRPGEIPTPGKK